MCPLVIPIPPTLYLLPFHNGLDEPSTYTHLHPSSASAVICRLASSAADCFLSLLEGNSCQCTVTVGSVSCLTSCITQFLVEPSMGGGACHSPLGCFRLSWMESLNRSIQSRHLVCPPPPTHPGTGSILQAYQPISSRIFAVLPPPPPPLLSVPPRCPVGLFCHPEELAKRFCE